MFCLMNWFFFFFIFLYFILFCFLVLFKIIDELWIFYNLNLGKCFINICSVVKKMELNFFMFIIISYFGFLLVVLIIILVLFISLNKICFIWNELNRRIFFLDFWYFRFFFILIINFFFGYWDLWVV